MYLSRTNSLVDVILYLLLSGMWAAGGWLLLTHAFRVRRLERLVAGLAVGFLLFISLGNLFANLIPLPIALWAASALILAAGLILAWKSRIRPWLSLRDLRAWPLLIALAGVTILFTLILKGEAIFDEYVHMPLISIMAAGDFPPHFYLNPAYTFAYHYALQVYAASLVRLGDLFPWSAWDVSRALAIAFTLVLGWVWVRRLTRSRLAAWLGSLLITFGGGARWLLLLLPSPWLAWVSRQVTLVGTGFDTSPSLVTALHSPWVIEGAGKAVFPFAFHNGIFIPAFFTLGSTGALPFMTILLLLLILPHRRFSAAGLIAWSLVFATLALSAEHLFVVIWVGIAGSAFLALVLRKQLGQSFSRQALLQWGLVLLISALVSLVQGGFITETARNLLASIFGLASGSYNARGFSLRWPPGLLDAHLGSLSIFNLGQLVTLLAELGPALLVVPVIFIRFKKQLVQRDWFTAGLAVSVVASLVFPLFFQYEVDRSITRMPATALWTGMLLAFPVLWLAFRHSKSITRLVMIAGYAVTLLAGLVLFRSQLPSITETQYSYYIDALDASYSADYWNKLPHAAQVLDRIPERSVTLFGRIARANSGIYTPLPEWEELIAHPDPLKIASAGYDYVYMDRAWWDRLTPAEQANFQQPCIDIVDERKSGIGSDYRLLVDVSACR